MGINGYRWVSMGIDGYRWISKGVEGYRDIEAIETIETIGIIGTIGAIGAIDTARLEMVKENHEINHDKTMYVYVPAHPWMMPLRG
jgi:hypothetical protein